MAEAELDVDVEVEEDKTEPKATGSEYVTAATTSNFTFSLSQTSLFSKRSNTLLETNHSRAGPSSHHSPSFQLSQLRSETQPSELDVGVETKQVEEVLQSTAGAALPSNTISPAGKSVSRPSPHKQPNLSCDTYTSSRHPSWSNITGTGNTYHAPSRQQRAKLRDSTRPYTYHQTSAHHKRHRSSGDATAQRKETCTVVCPSAIVSKVLDNPKLSYRTELEKIAVNVHPCWLTVTVGEGRVEIRGSDSCLLNGAKKKVNMVFDQIEQNITRETRVFPIHNLPVLAAHDIVTKLQEIENQCGVLFKVQPGNVSVSTFVKDLQEKFESDDPVSVSSVKSFMCAKEEHSWLAENDNGKFMPLSVQLCTRLNELFVDSGSRTVSFNAAEYIVDFGALTIIEKNSSVKRKLKFEKLAPKWEFWDEDFEWKPFYSAGSEALQSAFEYGNSLVTLKVDGIEDDLFLVDFDTMLLTEVTGRNKVCIQRHPPLPTQPLQLTFSVYAEGLSRGCQEAIQLLAETINKRTVEKEISLNVFHHLSGKELTKEARQYCISVAECSNDSSTLIVKGAKGYVQSVVVKLLESTSNLAAVGGRGREQVGEKAVMKGTEEWEKVCKVLHKTLPFARVVRVDRIENQLLKQRYSSARQRMHILNRGVINEKTLFHGTRETPPAKIYKSAQGFDFRLAREGVWGRGTYFAENASYSDSGYAHRTEDGTGSKQLLLAKVLTGEACHMHRPNRELNLPPIRGQMHPRAPSTSTGTNTHHTLFHDHDIELRYDSIASELKGSRIYIIYDFDQAYPEYLITYINI